MFCAECGAGGITGNFCPNCGTPSGNKSALSKAPSNKPLKFGRATNASQLVIDICEPRWATGFFEEDELTPAHFAKFTSGDWGTFAKYLADNASYPFNQKYYRDFSHLDSGDKNRREHSLDFSEYIDGVISQYMSQLDPSTDQLSLLVVAGFLGKLPYPTDVNGTSFWVQTAENIGKELDVIFDVLKIGKKDSFVGQNLDEILDALIYLSDFGLSTLIPLLGDTPKQQQFLRSMARPIDRSISISMASLMYFFTSGGRNEDLNQTLISPRLIHFLLDENNFIAPWWSEFAVWGTAGIAQTWKNYLSESALSIESWGEERLIQLLKNGLNEDLYLDKDTYKIFMQDREIFEGLLNFLES